MNTGQRLKKIIEDRGIRQTWLADRAGLNRVTLARIIGGDSDPHADTIRRLARALNVSSDYLLGLSDVEQAS